MLNVVKYQNSKNLISPLGFRKDWWFWKNNIKLNVKKIISFLLKEETKILKKYKSSGDGNVNLPNSVTARHASFNLFTIKDNKNLFEVKKFIKKNIKDLILQYNIDYKEVYIKCWFNVLRKGEEIKPHVHDEIDTAEMSFLAGNLFIEGEDTYTFYQTPFSNQVIKIKNIPGDLILFPPYIKHWTNINKSKKPRLSIAFDIQPSKEFCSPIYLKNKSIVKIKL